MDDLDLPPLSQATIRAARTPPRPSLLLTRKRTHADYDDDPATSSDPALFSSDEQAPDAENYVGGKRKKRVYKGSWWDRHPRKNGTSQISRKQELTRDFDSGIFMGSESSEELLSSDSFTLEDELLKDQQQQKTRHPLVLRTWSRHDQDQDQDQDVNSTPKRLAPKPAAAIPEEHEKVCVIVRQCLDMGKEDVDLSYVSFVELEYHVLTGYVQFDEPARSSKRNHLPENSEQAGRDCSWNARYRHQPRTAPPSVPGPQLAAEIPHAPP